MPIKSKKPRQYEVEKILAKKVDGLLASYKVKWLGYKQPTWEDSANLANCKDLVRAFEKEHARKQKKREARAGSEMSSTISTVVVNENELESDPEPINPEIEQQTIRDDMPPRMIPSKIWGSSKDSAGKLFFAVEFKSKTADNQNWEPELEPSQEEDEGEGPSPDKHIELISGAAMKKFCPLFLIEYYERHTVFLGGVYETHSTGPVTMAAASDEVTED